MPGLLDRLARLDFGLGGVALAQLQVSGGDQDLTPGLRLVEMVGQLERLLQMLADGLALRQSLRPAHY